MSTAIAAQGSVSVETDGKCLCCSSLGNALGKCQFAVDKTNLHITTIDTMTAAAAAAKSLQSCPTLCDPMDCSPPGSPVPGILQARTLEWVAISFSNA